MNRILKIIFAFLISTLAISSAFLVGAFWLFLIILFFIFFIKKNNKITTYNKDIVYILLAGFLAKVYIFFAIGIILHIAAESLGVHNKFCRDVCEKTA